MSQVRIRARRNQSIECARMIAAFFVVFVHSQFPGRFGKIVLCIARFAVPMFLMISGYFSYRVSSKKLAVRVRRMLWLNIMATSVYVLKRYLLESHFSWGLMETVLELAPGKRQLMEWLILSLNPYSEHLWYLAAACACYGVLWVYVKFFGDEEVSYRPFYGMCTGLFVLQFILGEMAQLLGVAVPYVLVRNFLLPGLPLFGLGLFLREYQDRLVENFGLTDRKLMAVIILGVGYSLFRRFAIGESEFTFGMIVAVAALILLLTAHPQVTKRHGLAEACISRFGFWSAGIYIIHQFFNIFYERLGVQWGVAVFGTMESVVRPVIVAVVSLLATIIIERLHDGGKLLFRCGKK